MFSVAIVVVIRCAILPSNHGPVCRKAPFRKAAPWALATFMVRSVVSPSNEVLHGGLPSEDFVWPLVEFGGDNTEVFAL